MATDTLSSPTVSASGVEMTFTTSGTLAGAITVDPTKITMSGTSEVDGSTDTDTRTNNIISATVSGSTLTCKLRNPWHDDDTSITVALAEGAFTDATGDVNAALGSTAVTNSSTLDYAVPVCLIASEVWRKFTDEDFYVDVYAVGGAYEGFRSNFGIASVSVTVTDNAGAGTAVTKSATALSAVDAFDATNGAYSKCVLFRVGPFNAATDWSGGATQALATITASAKPQIGDADAIRTSPTEYIFLDPDDDFEVRHAVVSTTGNDTTGAVATGDGGYWAGTDGVAAGAESAPYLTIHEAISECQRGDGTTAAPAHGTASWSIIYLEEGSHTLGTYSFGDTSKTTLGPVIITRKPGTTKSAVKITGSADSSGIRTNVFTLDDITIELGASGVINTGAPTTNSTVWTAADNYLIRRRCDWVGPGRAESMSASPMSGFENQWVYGGTGSGLSTLRNVERTSRDFHADSCSGDAWVLSGNTGRLMLNNEYSNFDPDGTGTHTDIVQFAGSAGHTCTNNGMSQIRVRDINGVQAPLFGNAATNDVIITGFAMTFVVSEDDGLSTHMQIDDLQMTNWFIYHNTLFDTTTLKDDADNFSQTNCWFVRNYCSIALGGAPATVATGFIENHNRNASGFTEGYDWTTGGSGTDDFVDVDATYKPLLTGDAVGRWEIDDTLSAFDGSGSAVTVAGFLGALQAAAASPVLGSTTASILRRGRNYRRRP